MTRRAMGRALLVLGCVPIPVVLAIPLLHSLFEGPGGGLAAAVRTAVILAPTLALGSLYIHRAMGRGETGLVLATVGLAVIQMLFLGFGRRGFEGSALYSAAVRSDAANLVSLQEIFRTNEGHYSEDADSLLFTPSEGVEYELHSSGEGWTARLTHRELGPDRACALWQGRTEALSAGSGRTPPEPGRVFCYQRHRLSGWGRVGDGLFTLHQRVDRALGLRSR